MRPAAWWLEWPEGLIRVGVVFLVAVTIVAVAVRYPGLVSNLDDRASENSSLSYSDREIAGGNSLVVDQAAVYAARGLIPENETFRVLVSPAYDRGSELTVPYVGSYYRYFLLPRRYSDSAPWIICYQCDPASIGAPVDRVWRGSDNISILRVRAG
jgi:hypothetical protein